MNANLKARTTPAPANTDPACRPATGSAVTQADTGASTRRRLFRNNNHPVTPTWRRVPAWLVRSLIAVAGAATAAGLLAAPASATVAPTPIAHSYPWSSCTVTVGDKSNPSSYAQGDVQVGCTTRHNIEVHATLWRWNGQTWALVENSPVLTWNNAYGADDWTTAYACGGGAYWQTVGYVSLDGSPWYYFDSNVNVKPYDPGNC
jgi:hypothetical protein